VIKGDSAIPVSRATGATTSMIPRDCDQPIDQRKGLPTVQMLTEGVKLVGKQEGKVTVKPHTTKVPKHLEDQKGISGARGGHSISLLGRRAIRRGEKGWMLTMNSYGVEISIAGGGEETVVAQLASVFCSSFFYDVFMVFRYKKLRAALAMARTKPIYQTKHKGNHIPESTANLTKLA